MPLGIAGVFRSMKNHLLSDLDSERLQAIYGDGCTASQCTTKRGLSARSGREEQKADELQKVVLFYFIKSIGSSATTKEMKTTSTHVSTSVSNSLS